MASNLGDRMKIANIIMIASLGYQSGRHYFTSNPFKMAKRLGRSAIGIIASPIVAPIVYSGAGLFAGGDFVREMYYRAMSAFGYRSGGGSRHVEKESQQLSREM
jgi:hypothetical protein